MSKLYKNIEFNLIIYLFDFLVLIIILKQNKKVCRLIYRKQTLN